MDTSQLVRKAKGGDDKAFSKLIEPIQEKLYVTAYSYVGNREDALDIVSEGVCRAYTSIKKLKNEALFNTWITRIVINLSIDVYNKNKKKVQIVYEDNDQGYIEEHDERIDLNKAIEALDPKYKVILQMKYYEGLTLAEIAKILEIPLGTIKSSLNKALNILRLELKEEVLE
ncbi:sigma-70 family RNA polymerase sigma factor [Clostridium intestinale]|uniref:RNA polymerase sigma-70 factor, ECF subfamily n=1 Tax=Clostridium intestinale DSM 6191 TaxID=1121320 RepID=A0A1M5YYI8_9CLOT|nr:sigma-70 family RNA polymerase sigma factor [Clostridium intestinale]SHI17089.1 RNA polymerase sigma-70 factor, ECF subfamily [Clostridium intestinale DSM 6191]